MSICNPDSVARKENRMSIMDRRADAMVRAYAMDEELRFKATARRNKLIGAWAAERLGKTGIEAIEYARAVVMADFEEVGDRDVLRKIALDLSAAGVSVEETEIARRLAEFGSQAVEDVKAGR